MKDHNQLLQMTKFLFVKCFQLPIKDKEIINMGIDIYYKWIFTDERPQPIAANDQIFIREMFRQLSLIFSKRSDSDNTDTKEHIYICNRVLDLFLQFGMTGDKMSEETWNHVLLLILGICDLNLRSDQGISELDYGILKVLFELWLCSLSYDKEMWLKLQELASQWVKHVSIINQWNSVMLALTERIVNLLYGKTEGTNTVIIKWQGLSKEHFQIPNVGNETTELNLPDEFVYFSWHILFHIIGNINKLFDPFVYTKALTGVNELVKIIAEVGTQLTPEILQRREDKILR
jgi:hypothetical protein